MKMFIWTKKFFFSISYVLYCFSLFRKREVLFFQFLILSIVFSVKVPCLDIGKSFFFQFLMLFIVFLFLTSLFKNGEGFFFFSV